MSKQNNPFNNFLFSIPGKRGKMTFDELKNVKGIKNKTVEIVDIGCNKKLGHMSGWAALLKFQ
jgi:hypothetical protein